MRISVTELDALRLYRSEDWMTLPMLLDRFRGEGEENEAMRAGTAFHGFLEHAQAGSSIDWLEHDGYTFEIDCNAELVIPRVRECKTERTFTIDGLEVTVVGKADTLGGREVGDYKLSADFDAENYTDALQWRTYLMLFDADKFTYTVFPHKRKGKTITIQAVEQMSFYRYEGLEEDVMRAIKDLTRFLVEHLPERITAGDEKRLTF